MEKAKTCEKPWFCFTDDHLYQDGQQIRLGEEEYHIIAHGYPDSMTVFGVPMSHDEVAEILSARADYAGENIALIGCSMGDERFGVPFAQN